MGVGPLIELGSGPEKDNGRVLGQGEWDRITNGDRSGASPTTGKLASRPTFGKVADGTAVVERAGVGFRAPRKWWACLFLVVLGGVALPWEVPLSKWMIDGGIPSDVRALFQRAELFGHAYGLIGIVVTLYFLDPVKRKAIMPTVLHFAAAGLLADLIKIMVWRVRPRAFWQQGGDGMTFVGTIWTHGERAWATITDHAYHSFPSAHTACAVALAFQLGRLYPRGRTWFFVLAALCAMNRIDGGAHFVSDVCWGAALGTAVSLLAVKVPWPDFARRPTIRGPVACRRAAS